MASLQESLLQSEEYTTLSKPTQLIYLTLAKEFQTSTEYLFLSPEEITRIANTGTTDQWQSFLTLQTVQNYIKVNMAFLSQIAQRKTFQSLVQMAVSGGAGAQQAAKQVQELSGIMNQQDSNKIIILHSIPRRKEVTQ